jgi:uncharacterized protein (DUF2062 family)
MTLSLVLMELCIEVLMMLITMLKFQDMNEVASLKLVWMPVLKPNLIGENIETQITLLLVLILVNILQDLPIFIIKLKLQNQAMMA